MSDTKDRRAFLESLGIKTDGFHGMKGEWTEIHERLYLETKRTLDDRMIVYDALFDMFAACFFCIRKQQEQIAELKERLK